jgi:pre-mRNA-splicing factor ISY1
MARNVEKAQNILNRYLAGKQEEARGPRSRRPYLASECDDLNEADKWRHQILREIGRKVMEIQNAGLGDHRIRDLNDEINKLIREKSHWERRIVELGGPDYAKTGPKITDSEGRPVTDVSGRGAGYRYFGAAKNLPGVRELFEKEAPRQVRYTRAELHRRIDADYYGYRDEDDGVLAAVEAEAEAAMRTDAIKEWEQQQAERQRAAEEAGAAAAAALFGDGTGDETRFVAYVPLPEPKEIEARVLQSKKAALIAKYASKTELDRQEEAAQLLNRQ